MTSPSSLRLISDNIAGESFHHNMKPSQVQRRAFQSDPHVHQFCEDSLLRGHRPITVDSRQRCLLHVADVLGHPLVEATPEELHAYARSLRDTAVWTRITYMRTLQVFFGWAVTQRLIDDSPAASLPIPRQPRGVPKPMPDDDQRIALANATDERLRLILLIGLGAGLRAGEIARLRREEVIARPGGSHIEVVNGKGGKDRVVPIGPGLAAALVSYRSGRGRFWVIGSTSMSALVSKYFRSIDMTWTCHSLRHSFGTRLYQESNGDARLVQDVLGHADLKSVAIYTAWSPRVADSAVNAVDSFLCPPVETELAA